MTSLSGTKGRPKRYQQLGKTPERLAKIPFKVTLSKVRTSLVTTRRPRHPPHPLTESEPQSTLSTQRP